jgi:hypothetical protein
MYYTLVENTVKPSPQAPSGGAAQVLMGFIDMGQQFDICPGVASGNDGVGGL